MKTLSFSTKHTQGQTTPIHTTDGLTPRIDTDKRSSKQISPDGERYGKTVER